MTNFYEDKVLAQLDLFRKRKLAKASNLVVQQKKKRKKRDNPEYKIQCAINNYCELFLTDDAMWQATESSTGDFGSWQQDKLNKKGAKKGFPDGELIYNGGNVYVEIKAPDGVISPEQHAMHDRLRRMKKNVEVVYSLDEFQAVVRKYGVPNREAL